MKNVFEINLSTQEQNCKKFVVKEVSEELKNKRDELSDTFATIQKNSAIPIWLSVIYYISLFAAVIITTSLISSVIKVGFTTAYHNASWAFYVGAASILISVPVFFYKRHKMKKIESDPAVQTKIDESDKLVRNCCEYLGIPSEAEDIDIFSNVIKIKNGKSKQATALYQYTNFTNKIFKDSNNLYISDYETVFAFPLNSFTKIIAINKNATFNTWLKEQPFNKGFYKQYKIRCNNYGVFFVKPYHSIRFTAFNEEYEIIIPNYELQTFLKYVNLNVMYENK